jgi:hypothetical protein
MRITGVVSFWSRPMGRITSTCSRSPSGVEMYVSYQVEPGGGGAAWTAGAGRTLMAIAATATRMRAGFRRAGTS